MTSARELNQRRRTVQKRRDELADRERTVVDLRMVHSTLERRVQRTVRGVEPVRSTAELVDHVERLLRRHADGDRTLDYLRPLVRTVSVSTMAQERASSVPGANDQSPVDVSNLRSDAFPGELFGFVDATGSGSDSPRRGPVVSAYETVLDAAVPVTAAGSEAVADLQRSLVAVGVLLDVARIAVSGGGDRPSVPDDVSGQRARLDDALGAHVESLKEADRRLLGASEPDPYEALNWHAPVVVLPVRLETRFAEDELLVRVYHDQIHVDTHEDQLTESEHRRGREFWTRLWLAGVENPATAAANADSLLPASFLSDLAAELSDRFEADDFSPDPGDRFEEVRERAWGRVTEQFGEERASYVVHALSPRDRSTGDELGETLLEGWQGDLPFENAPAVEFPDVDLRPDSWTKEPRAPLLPDRFLAFAYWDAADESERTTDWHDTGRDGVYDRRAGDEFVRRVGGPRVREPLAVGPSPEAVAAAGDDDAMTPTEWMTTFSKAEDAGMALRVPLPDGRHWREAGEFSKLVVVGMKTSMPEDAAREALTSQLTAAAATEGLELLEPGTPTNNADEPSGRSEARDPAASVDDAVGPPLADPGTDGFRVARALGVDSTTFDHVPGADVGRDADAGAMNRVLWPATVGYYVRNLLGPTPGGTESSPWPTMYGTGASDAPEGPPRALRWLETYRQHFVEFVRGGGPFPSLRAGRQPYGLLPVSPLDVQADDRTDIGVTDRASDDDDGSGPWSAFDWQPTRVPPFDDATFVPELVERVWSLRDQWLSWSANVPSVASAQSLSDDQLLELLAMEATAYSYRRQLWLLGDDHPLYDYASVSGPAEDTLPSVRELTSEAGESHTPRIADFLFLGVAAVADDVPITDDDVTRFLDDVAAAFETFDPSLLVRLLGVDADENVKLAPGSEPTDPDDALSPLGMVPESADADDGASLLRQLVRFAALQAMITSRIRTGAVYGHFSGETVRLPAEPTSYGRDDETVFERFEETLPSGRPFSGGDELDRHPQLDSSSRFTALFWATATAGTDTHPPPDPVLSEFLTALGRLSSLDPDRLARLTTETTDLASHRLDGWWTSLATRRLFDHRESHPTDVHVGAYGFVENLAPGSGPDAEYLLAPSIDQATTASVLRSAHSGRATAEGTTDDGGSADALAVDLTAEQVQRARPLLRGVRYGQDLPELLGYRFERGLREASRADAADYEAHLDDFRAVAPSVAGKIDRDVTDTERQTKERDVVDGMRLYRLWKDGKLWQQWQETLGSSPPADLRAAVGGDGPEDDVSGIMDGIDRAMQAVNDVLVAEGVHHLVHGRPDRASAALEALSRGKRPPEPSFLDTPRSETGVTHRLLLGFGDVDDPAPPTSWQPTDRDVLRKSDFPRLGVDSNESETTDATPEPVQVRHDAEPSLNEWVGELLPEPGRIGCTGEFQWEADRAFAVGAFETPNASGTVTVNGVGFEPDLVLFTAVTGETTSETTESHSTGWSRGAYRTAAGSYGTVQQATSASVDADGTVAHRTTDSYAVDVAFPASGVDGARGRVSATTDEGFEVTFDVVDLPADGPDSVSVQYRAFALPDPTSVRVGTFRTPETEPSDPVTETFSGDAAPADDFDPDHVLFSTVVPVEDGGSAPTAVGFAQGEVKRSADGTFVQSATGVGVDPGADGSRVTASEDAIVDVRVGGTDPLGLRLSVTDFGDGPLLDFSDDGSRSGLGGGGLGRDLTDGFGVLPSPVTGHAKLAVSSPTETAYPGAVPVTYVAIESPRTSTPTGEAVHRPAFGHVVAPDADDDAVTVRTGFRPGYVEVRLLPDVSDGDGDALPVSTTVSAAETVLSVGAATSRAAQQSLGTGFGSDSTSTRSDGASVAGTPSAGTDGPTRGPTATLTSVSDEGFSLRFQNLDGSERPLAFYRAWPAVPDAQGFAVPIPGGVGLDELALTPLDAIALTQGVREAGDSQLERRIGYHAFRNRPDSRPPVPDEATLDLSFTERPDGSDVSIAEYVTVAGEIRDVVGEARPADATDFVHPADESGPGHVPDDPDAPGLSGTVGELAARASEAERTLETIRDILEDRVALLSGESNVCDDVEALEDAVRRFRRSVPVTQTVEVAETLAPTADSEDDPTSEDVVRTLLDELRTVADAVRPGPTDGADAAVLVDNASDVTIAGDASVASRTDLSLTVRSHSDALTFSPKTRSVTTDDRGAFDATFDFSGVPPGTEFTVVASTQSGQPRDRESARKEAVADAVAAASLPVEFALLVELAVEGVYDPSGYFELRQMFVDVVREASDWDLDPADRFARLVAEFEGRGRLSLGEMPLVPPWYADADLETRIEQFVESSRHGHLRVLKLLGRQDEYERFRRVSTGAEVVYAANGRVTDGADTTGSRPLGEVIAEQRYLPLVLWLDRVSSDYRPGESAAAAAVDDAVDDVRWGLVKDERKTLQATLDLLTSGGRSPETLTPADRRAVADLWSLQSVDLSDVAQTIRVVVGPVAWTGLTELVAAAGEPSRPTDQPFWRVGSPSVNTLVEKHPEGEVRARLERLDDYAATDSAPKLAAYSPVVRQAVRNEDVPHAFVADVERFVADPEAVLGALGTVAPGVADLLADLHAFLHHADAFVESNSVSRLRQRTDDLLQTVRNTLPPDERGQEIEALQTVLAGLQSHEEPLERASTWYRVFAFNRQQVEDSFVTTHAGSLDELRTVTTETLSDRLLAVTAHDDVSKSFRRGVLEPLRRALLRASYFGIYGSVPAVAAGGSQSAEDALLAQAETVKGDVSDRYEAAKEYRPSNTSGSPTVQQQVDRIRALLGEEFPVLPPFVPANVGELRDSLAADVVSDPYATDTWLQRVSRVRDRPKSFQRVRTYADALSIANESPSRLRRTLDVAQLPHVAGQNWLGEDDVTPNGGELSLAVDFASRRADSPIATNPSTVDDAVAGLLVDEWVERVPDSSESVGLGLRYDDPGTRPPQSILLAVPPTWKLTRRGDDSRPFDAKAESTRETYWTEPLVRQTMAETLELIHVRSVDLEALEDFGHLLPMLCFAYNEDTFPGAVDRLPDAPSVDFGEFDWRWT